MVERSRKKGRLSCLLSELVFPSLGITLAMILLALVMSSTILRNSFPKRKRDRGVDGEQRERKSFDKSGFRSSLRFSETWKEALPMTDKESYR